MIQNVIFDLGNVVLDFHPYAYFIKVFHEEDRTRDICRKVFEGELWNAYDQGLYTKQELREQLCERYPDDVKEIETVLNEWLHILVVRPDTERLMKLLKQKGYDLYIMSNLSEESYCYLKEQEAFFTWTKGAALSFAEKINKPDPRLYQILMERYHLDNASCVFLDDRIENIETAVRLGMHGIVYRNHQQALHELRTLLGEELEC
ncbi:MAG: HAD family phosphatase [Erysipelotrichaceae bacterium]|nr:HAD family phosphatase [Erysipelotrichaceae bacterium]